MERRVVEPARCLPGDVHVAARHHRRQRRAARHPEGLDTDLTGLQWVVDAYTLLIAALTLTMGTLADRFGRRRLL